MPRFRETQGVQTYVRLLRYVRPYWKAFAVASLGMAVYAATDAGFAALVEPVLNGSFVDKNVTLIRLMPFAIIGIFIIRAISGFVSNYGVHWVARSVIRDLRRDLFTHMLRLPAAYYDGASSGMLLSRVTYDTDQVSQASSTAITVLVRDTLTVVFLLVLLFYQSWLLTLVFLLVGPAITYIIVKVSKRFRTISRKIQRTMGEVSHVTEEAIEGQRVVKIFGAQDYESQRFATANQKNRQQMLKLESAKLVSVGIIELVAACGIAVVVYLAGMESLRDAINVGEFSSFMTALILLYKPMKRIANVNMQVQRGVAAAESVFSVLDQDQESDSGQGTLEHPRGAIAFENVSFSYGADKGNVLHNVSLVVEPGETAAFVGRSGSGKSTLINLLPRFYDLQHGTVRLDGHDIRSFTLRSLRDQIALVSQHVTLFNDTIRNNIAYGTLKSTSEREIVRACELAYAMEFIERMPQGLDTLVGENGVMLSGGQRQRLAIARALLKDAPILILDEATSALDTQSERYIQAALETLMADRTTLVVAHRLSTIENADVIFVMDEGRIVETGTHDELLQHDGHYAHLYRSQRAYRSADGMSGIV